MTYQPPVRDQLFVLRDVLELERYANLPGFADATPDLVEQILDQAARFCGEVLAPLNAVGDKQGCRWSPDHTVTTPDGFKAAYQQFVDAGWPALGAEPAYGGQGLPAVVNLAVSEMSSGANMAFAMYPGLTHGTYSAILNGGSQAQKDLYLPRLASGRWAGTMNLTEPHCGTDLGLLRTKAVAHGDGSYRISGQKIWISGGEQDLTENIVHLVLARIEGAPAGVRGISLFIVPKFIPNADGTLGDRNGVKCLGLESKMGIHGNATCVLAHDESTGWLVGEENRGLALMFVMMNEARIGVGLQGIAQAEGAYQAAAAFAKERLQGRALTGPKNPDGPADPIIVHPDVRRMLLDAAAMVEGGRAFLFWTALQGDLARAAADEAERRKASDFMALLTPVVKAFLTDQGFQVCSNAMQIHGGAGYTEHLPLSQYLRDVRIAMIYEGTNGVQALDLVGRKLAADGGRAVMAFFAELDAYAAANKDDDALAPIIAGLAQAKGELQEATLWLMQNGMANPDNAGAASSDYLHLFGLTALAYMWARIAKVSQAKVAAGDSDPFYARKLVVARHFVERVLPQAGAHLRKLKAGSQTLMSLPADAF
ncbi:MAG: acyl-CoA dehydrogenase C-terminal domain-containing protein [Phenylobacterium sp.]|uniref:acyl-CoA dehydrogenase C-terminal domain-containing protein n=1 Tax=Phenylobacterium sp. TaxID=1871053 RepID=UPI002737307A|nr:acyl-CoA dehydrogenase C-terminal domain-containing protein [Phenylobacterium sp.]MDP3173473.1 acyl-CoA dehydrogenase C-terminal domain-containing protein [Phenylobacterium sp.]